MNEKHCGLTDPHECHTELNGWHCPGVPGQTGKSSIYSLGYSDGQKSLQHLYDEIEELEKALIEAERDASHYQGEAEYWYEESGGMGA